MIDFQSFFIDAMLTFLALDLFLLLPMFLIIRKWSRGKFLRVANEVYEWLQNPSP